MTIPTVIYCNHCSDVIRFTPGRDYVTFEKEDICTIAATLMMHTETHQCKCGKTTAVTFK